MEKKKRKWIEPKAMKMFFISYAGVLCIPIIVLSAIIIFFIGPSIESDIYTASSEKLEASSRRLSDILTDMEHMTASISGNVYLTPYTMKSERAYEGRNQLHIYKQSSFLLSDIIYYMHGETKLFTSETSTSVKRLIDVFYPFEEISDELFFLTLPLLVKPYAVGMTLPTQKKYVLFAYPINPPLSNVTILYLIESDKISDIFGAVNSRYRENVLLYENNMSLLMQTGKFDEDSYDWVDSLEFETNKITQQTISKQFYVSTIQLDKLGLKLVSVTEKDAYMSRIYGIQWIFSIAMIIVVIIGFTVILVISRIKYRPIHMLEDKLNDYKNMLRGQIIKEAPRGAFTGAIPFDELFTPNDMSHYACIVLLREKEVNIQQISISDANAVLCGDPNAPVILSVEETSDDLTIFVLAAKQDIGSLDHYAKRIAEILYPGEDFPLCCGGFYEDILSISKSYNDAVSQFSEDNAIFNRYSQNSIEKLKAAILDDDADAIQSVLMELFSSLARKKTSKFILHSLLLDILSVLMDLTLKHNMIFDDLQQKFNEILDIRKTPEKLQIDNNYLVNVCFNVCNFICENINRKTRLLENVKQYFAEHYSEHTFSVEKAALHFNVSMPYLSHFFKEKTGQTLISYLWELRKESAEHYLLTTDLPIKDIVDKVGYYDVSSFTRKFKASTKLSPSEFRRIGRTDN